MKLTWNIKRWLGALVRLVLFPQLTTSHQAPGSNKITSSENLINAKQLLWPTDVPTHTSVSDTLKQALAEIFAKLKPKRIAARYRVLPTVPALPSSAMEVFLAKFLIKLQIDQQIWWVPSKWDHKWFPSKRNLGVHQGEAECSAAYTGSSLMTCTSGASLLTPYGWVLLLLLLFSLHRGPLINSSSFSSTSNKACQGVPAWLLLWLLLDWWLDLWQLSCLVTPSSLSSRSLRSPRSSKPSRWSTIAKETT